MATIAPIVTDISGNGDVMLFEWTLTTANHTGDSIPFSQWADRSVVVTSAAYGGSTTALEGSNDGVTYVGLADPQGTAIAKTADAVEAVLELTQYARPRLSTVGSAATVKVTLLCRRATHYR
jgi:hypothetical protein